MALSEVPSWHHRTITAGDTGPDVVIVQRKTGATPTGVYDPWTEQRIVGLQMRLKLRTTGEVDEATAVALGETSVAGMVPEWFFRELRSGDHGSDVEALRGLLGEPDGTGFDAALEQAVRRWQSAHRIRPDGTVTEGMAIALGDV